MQKLMWLVIAVVIAGGGFFLWQSTQAPAMNADDNIVEVGAGSQVPIETAPVNTGMTATVTYDGKSFSPSEVTIKKGGKVTFNSTSGEMWVASGPHPQHTKYDGTSREAHCAAGAVPSFDQCIVGTIYTFTFDKIGTSPYHNHVNAGVFGKVVVVE